MVEPLGAAQLNKYTSGKQAGSLDDLYALIRHFEASGAITPSGSNRRYLRAYDDYGQHSIGYGTNVNRASKKLGIPVDELMNGREITIEQAEQLMRDEMQEIRNDVIAKLKRYESTGGHPYTQLDDSQINALTSFAYNLGPGNLNQLTDNGNRDLATVQNKMLEYNKAGPKGEKKELAGLTKRRNSEYAMFTGSSEKMADVATSDEAGVGASAQPDEPQYEDRVLVDVPHEEVTGPGEFANLALGEDVDLGERTPPEEYVPDMSDSFENTVAQMDYVAGFYDLIELLEQPTIKVQYKP